HASKEGREILRHTQNDPGSPRPGRSTPAKRQKASVRGVVLASQLSGWKPYSSVMIRYFSRQIASGGVARQCTLRWARGKYCRRLLREGANVAVLEPDVAEKFRDSAAVNDALRSLLQVSDSTRRLTTRSRRTARKHPAA
ncbi:MAG: hypothetical protein AAB502_06480, partial [Chloroflexota bacterium]